MHKAETWCGHLSEPSRAWKLRKIAQYTESKIPGKQTILCNTKGATRLFTQTKWISTYPYYILLVAVDTAYFWLRDCGNLKLTLPGAKELKNSLAKILSCNTWLSVWSLISSIRRACVCAVPSKKVSKTGRIACMASIRMPAWPASAKRHQK